MPRGSKLAEWKLMRQAHKDKGQGTEQQGTKCAEGHNQMLHYDASL